MYLSVLSNEEKALFLGLAYDLAVSDGNYSAEEQAAIAGYSQEMQLPFDENSMKKPIDAIIDKLSEISDMRTKKIVVFESIGLVMADHNFDERERAIVAKMETEFRIPQSFGKKCEDILNEYFAFQDRINKLVLE